MKVRVYEVEDIRKGFYFCPSCHRKVDLPFKGEVKLENALNLQCGNCNKGKMIVKIKKDK